jgi:hypothetical protein
MGNYKNIYAPRVENDPTSLYLSLRLRAFRCRFSHFGSKLDIVVNFQLTALFRRFSTLDSPLSALDSRHPSGPCNTDLY